MGSVNLSLIDVPENTFETENNVAFDPSKLDINCPEKEVMIEAVVRMLQKIKYLSNSKLIKNADGLLSRKWTNVNVEWVGQLKQRLPPNKYKMSSNSVFDRYLNVCISSNYQLSESLTLQRI